MDRESLFATYRAHVNAGKIDTYERYGFDAGIFAVYANDDTSVLQFLFPPNMGACRRTEDAEDDGWQFIFHGANLDSQEAARGMGMRRATVVDWEIEEESHSPQLQQTRCRDKTKG